MYPGITARPTPGQTPLHSFSFLRLSESQGESNGFGRYWHVASVQLPQPEIHRLDVESHPPPHNGPKQLPMRKDPRPSSLLAAAHNPHFRVVICVQTSRLCLVPVDYRWRRTMRFMRRNLKRPAMPRARSCVAVGDPQRL
jgi:hypothetical protein